MKYLRQTLLVCGLFLVLFGNGAFAQTNNIDSTIIQGETTQIDSLQQSVAVYSTDGFEAIIYITLLLVISYGMILGLSILYAKRRIPLKTTKWVEVSIVLITLYLIVSKVVTIVVNLGFTGQIISASLLLVFLLLGYTWIQNFLAWIYLSVKPIIYKGSHIEAGAHNGVIIKAGYFNVVLSTTDGKEVIIQNRNLIERGFSIKKVSSVILEFYVPKETDLKKIQELFLEAAKVSPYIDLDFEPEINFTQVVLNDRPWIKAGLLVCADSFENEVFLKNDLVYRIQKELN